MGQIIIDIPNELTSEDREDVHAAREARSEESIAWEEAKTLLGV